MFELNKKLSQLFKDMSLMYSYLGLDNRFRSLAYSKASKVINSLTVDIDSYSKNHDLKKLPGIGEGIEKKIEEFVLTGKIKKYDELKNRVPLELLDLSEIKGIGMQSIKRIHNELNISNKNDFIEALKNGLVGKLKNFGDKKVLNMMRGLKLHKIIEERMLLWDALIIAEQIVLELKKNTRIIKVELAGSLRRKNETIGDIDIILSCKEKDRKQIIDMFCECNFVKKIILRGEKKVSVLLKYPEKQVDLLVVNDSDWGSALLYFTGSKAHNIHLRTIAKERDYKISEYGLFNNLNHEKLVSLTESEIYNYLGFQFIPPEMREDNGELELASKFKIPKLIELTDIKGDLQMHSNWSDGINTMDEIVNFINKNFPYDYIAFTDHSKSSRIANGLNEKQILKQIKKIDEINNRLEKDFVKKGIEVDILKNGLLDISDDVLAQLDWVTASIHNNLNFDNTMRIQRACENPHVNCIGHPTCRLIGFREASILNIEEILKTAKKNNVALEINAQPNRMDLNDDLTMIAQKNNLQLVINTDSHALDNFNYMKLGVFIARRAWCTKNNILNTKSWKDIELFKLNKSNILIS